MILVKIDVTKIEKARLFKGEKGTYLDICLIETPNGKYDQDYMVTQSITKEERDRGVKSPILGNGKIIGQSRQSQAPRQDPAPRPAAPASQENLDEDVPF